VSVEKNIFKNASTTYFWSARFFPKGIRDDVFKLYSFVRIADDYVDHLPQQKAKFRTLRRAWEAATADPHFSTTPSADDMVDQRVVKNIVHVQRAYAFDPAWIVAFLDSMQADLDGKRYETLDDTLWYIHGSAEVIGLMMARIMNLSPAAYEAAKLQGRAMQYINFIRDIDEDLRLGRCYFPQEDLRQFGLVDLSYQTVAKQRQAFRQFMALQLSRYREWQAQANEGLRHIPRRPRIAIKTAIDMYNWTGAQIHKQPHAVYDRQIKPTKGRVLRTALKNILK
jgi:phytoene synthase